MLLDTLYKLSRQIDFQSKLILIFFLPSGVLTFVNCYEVKWATFVQDFFTYAKLTALAAIIIAGFVQLGRGKVEYFTWDNTETDVTKIALSFYSGLFAYNGKCVKMCQNMSF